MAPIHSKSILLLPLLFITVLIVSVFFSTAAAAAAARRDSITPTQPLADNETLVSAGGTFILGFFTPNNSDGRRYIGMWYNNITVQTIVWVANRANPVIRSTGQLSLTANGTITITDRDSTHVVWSVVANLIGLSNPVVQLLDTGNFVVKEEAGDSSQNKYAWQSFDYPTDTLWPGMKLGVDKVTGLSRNLTAWRSEDDPSPGDYCAAMVIGDNNPEMYLFNNRSSKVWRSGPWDGIQLGALRSWKSNIFAYSFVNNYREVAFSFQVINDVTAILRVGQSGVLQLLVWLSSAEEWALFWQSPANECDNIDHCGSYSICDINNSPNNICRCLQGGFTPKNPANWEVGDYNDGCVRRVKLDCREGTHTDTTFLSVNGVKLPESSISLDTYTFSLDSCRSECLKNCSCTAYAISAGGGGCVIWVTDLFDVVQLVNAGQDLYIRNGSTAGAGTQSTGDAAGAYQECTPEHSKQ